MPRVPYEPYPTAQPQGGGERVSVQTPGAAFGENIGAALENLGGTTEKVGGELFNRAIAMQDLANENAARAAQSDYALKSSELHAQFGALTGEAAAQQLPAFVEKQRQLREDIGSRLTSPMARKYYDADSLPFMQRNVFSAAGHAAEQNKVYTLDTYDASMRMSIQNAALHPDDDNYVAQQRAEIRQKAQDYAFLKFGVQDPNDPNVKLYVSNALSAQRAEQILGKNRTDPVTANEWVQKYGADLTNPADRDRVIGQVEYKGASVAAGTISAGILQAHRQPDGTYDASVKQMQDEARGRAKQLMPDNALAPEMAAQRIDGLSYSGRVAARLDTADATKKVRDTIYEMGIHDDQALLAVPGMDHIVQMLDPKIKGNLQAWINDFWKGSDRLSSQESLKIINGMRTEGTQESLADFMAINPGDPKWHLSTTDQIKVQDWQFEMAKKPQDDPRVGSALKVLKDSRGPELAALGVLGKGTDPNDYYHFVGALQERLQIWQEDHNGKRPSDEEVRDIIGPQIIKTQYAKPGMIFGSYWTSQEPAFREYQRPDFEDIPDEWRQRVIKEVTDRGGTVPTNNQLVQAYARMQFLKFYKQAKPSE